MYVMMMNEDKDLVTTIRKRILRGEKGADSLLFLLPAEYEDFTVANGTVTLRYILPTGKGRSETMTMLPEPYKDYLQYTTPVNTRLTSIAGDVTLWLQVFDTTGDVVLKTGEAILTIEDALNIDDYLCGDAVSQLDDLTQKVSDLRRETRELQLNKADNLMYDEGKTELQLTAEGVPIGDAVNLGKINEALDSVISFDPIEPTPPTPGGDDGDDVIYFDPDASELSADDVIYF